MVLVLLIRLSLLLLFLLLLVIVDKAIAMSATSLSSTKKAGLIFLHGLGDGPSGWQGTLIQQLPTFYARLGTDVEYRFPAAPTIPITINGGMHIPGWFDLYEWPINVGDPDDTKGQLAAVQQMEQEIHALEQKGIPRNRIVLGGFSQGGSIALLTSYYSSPPNHKPRPPLAACVCLSGWLTQAKEMTVANPSTPLFWAHGRYDDKVLYRQQEYGIEQLKTNGVEDITSTSYPMGHESTFNELRDLADFLNRVFFGSKDDEL